jgi:Spy/CpxP family protein refolding chaperone
MKLYLALIFFLGNFPAIAQHHVHNGTANRPSASSYSGEEQRSIKALSDDMIDDYRNGRGMGMAKAAELNHYPGPMHILQLKVKLRLTPEQTTRIQAAFEQMHEEAVRLGKSLIEQEQALDSVFRTATADSLNVRRFSVGIGETQAKIRFAHLNAHITAQKILTAEQIAIYDKERGYSGGKTRTQKKKHSGK